MKAATHALWYALWCFLCLLGYILWESALALLALLWTGLRWPIAQAHRAWRKPDTCQRD